MSLLEYNEVMKAVGILFHRWEDLTIEFGGTFYAVVKGKIPLEVANIIYKKYPNNPYGIRVAGGCSSWDPKNWAISNKYIETYHIDTKEGLVIFITEMKDYLARKQGNAEIEVQRFNELMISINTEIIKKVNPDITNYEWMQVDKENNRDYFNTLLNEENISFKKEFRKAIDDFDKTINPFINTDIELDEVENYIQKVNISANAYKWKEKCENCCQMLITDLKSGNKASYYRNQDGFSYQLHYILGEEQYLDVLHYYSTKKSEYNAEGEVIAIDYWGDNVEQKIDVRYNLTSGTIGETYGEKFPITPIQEKYIYNELLKVIELASSVTIDNMKKESVKRQLKYIENN